MKVFSPERWLIIVTLVALLTKFVYASLGDRLPDFRECVKVSYRARLYIADMS